MQTNKMLVSKEYFELELTFVRALMVKTGKGLGETIFLYTDFFRRFELGNPNIENLVWQEYVQKITDENVLEVTYETYLEHRGVDFHKDKEFGCFSFHKEGEGVIFVHFKNKEPAGVGPLSKGRVSFRMAELKEMFAYIKAGHPDAKKVKGRSWLYNLPSYCRLYPSEYTDHKETEKGAFQAMSLWGQFVSYDGQVKGDMRQKFLENLKGLDPANPSDIFPFQVTRVGADIEYFYTFYGL